jgi:NDP-mannose synthase
MTSEEPNIYDELLRRGHAMAPMSGMRAVILAGGRGTRLAPYTSILPKPLMPIGDRAILELVVDRLAAAGITKITLSVGHLAHLIRAVFEEGARRGVTIGYVHEQEELGTAGPLTLVEDLDTTFLMMNGDVLTTLDYARLLDVHRSQGNLLTIAAHRREIKIDYGVLHVDSDEDPFASVTSFDEKPAWSALVSMGVYVMEPELLELIPVGEKFDVPDLIRVMLERDLRVGTCLHEGLWFDIGRHADYEAAVSAWLSSADGLGTVTHDQLVPRDVPARPLNGHEVPTSDSAV